MDTVEDFLIKNWYFEEYDGEEFVLWGDVYRDENICAHVKIHTSPIRKMLIEDNVFYLSTKHSSYRVLMEEHYNQLVDFRRALAHFGYAKEAADVLVRCKAKALRRDMEATMKQYQLPADCAFIAVDTVKDYGRVKAYMYVNGAGELLRTKVHRGDFQNAIEISRISMEKEVPEKEALMLRYLPREFAAVFHRFEAAVPVYLQNPDEFEIEVRVQEKIYRIAPGGLVCVKASDLG